MPVYMPVKDLIHSYNKSNSEQEDDAVSFSADSSPESWAGHMDEEDDMPEEAVREYIKDNNLKLFQKLRGLPLASSDIPLSFHGQRTLRRLRQDGTQPQPQHSHCVSPSSLAIKPAAMQIQNPGIASQPGLSYAESLIIKVKEHIESKLSNGYVLDQRQLSPIDAPLPCDFALCIGRLFNIAKQQYYVIEYDCASSTSSKAIVSNAPEYYCNECFDTIFKIDEQLDTPEATEIPERLLLDGIGHESVMHAADRLYPDIRPQNCSPQLFLDNCGYPDQAFNWPSNSPQNHARRAYKQYEMKDTLTYVDKYEKAMIDGQVQERDIRSRSSSPDASVLITRPAYIEPRKDRYKKQGLTRYDWQKYIKEKQRNELIECSRPMTPQALPVELPDQIQERFCYCREADDGTEMLRCSTELCPVGWFHFRCTGLGRLPTVNEQFFCCYCSNKIDAFVTKAISDDGDGHLTDPDTPLAATFARVQPQSANQDVNEVRYDDVRNICQIGLTHEEETLHNKDIRCWAINNPDYCADTTEIRFIDTNDDEPEDEDANIPQILNQTLSRRSTSSQLSPTIPILTSGTDNNTTSSETPDPPVTPPLQPVRPATQPWGTPINLEKLNILNPVSPCLNCKRKHDLVEDQDLVLSNRVEIDGEIADSDDEGEVVTLMMDLRTLKECNR